MSSQQKLKFKSPEETRAWVVQFQPQLQRPCVVLLSGTLGAGKTQLTRWFLEALGIANVASPTFAIHHAYLTAGGQTVDHLDIYRLQDDVELENTGLWDILKQPLGLVFVEWADRLPDSVWPDSWTRIAIHLEQPDRAKPERRLTYEIKRPVGRPKGSLSN